ncbi:Death domain-containing adapter protein BG4 [Melipona quadrifasciata]|uniref:Death domain-containing adapter protein BG4 n=1 Tax=Melipona quadrifasciata TaxID=166423 RepID=A0A0M9A655_9HYME|nr:Death domain-containing adapter protein BG4 [Melipona quadrifasciata]
MEQMYICLREEFVSAAQYRINKSTLNTLKEYYMQYIDSNRKLSQIKDLTTLVKILEKRDILSCYNVKPFLHILSYFSNESLQSKIKNYNIYVKSIPYFLSCNMYQEINENTNEDKCEISNRTGNSSLQTISNKLEDEFTLQYKDEKRNLSTQETTKQILSHLSERIGRSWRDTVRNLGVPEYQIDIIENKYPFDLKEQSYQALKLYMSQYSNNNWKINLINALEKARRRDLKELVEKLVLEN